jgi:hydroxymethylbilane synthase
MKITIGSRGSKLALWQATWVKNQLIGLGHQAHVKVIKTTGDKFANAPLVGSGTKGLFIKEIEEALLAGVVDVAVHSLKDLPTEQPDGLSIAAVPARGDARDVLVANGWRWAELRPHARLGTSSLRRQTQLRALRPDVEVIALRGNVDTRLRKLDRGECDALVLAAAGLGRLGLGARITEFFGTDQICPAVGQGALALEIRREDEKARRAVEPLDHAPSHQAVRAERALLRSLGGGCQVPIAGYAFVEGEGSHELKLIGVVASPDGAKVIRACAVGSISGSEGLGVEVAQDLLKQGAQSLLS